jgi:aryl sulfotransferase
VLRRRVEADLRRVVGRVPCRMAAIRRPSGEHRHAIEDSLRWRDFEHRSDDIFISTPPKSGTTWMQGIVSSLLWPAGDAPGDRSSRSPWVDVRSRPIDEVLAHLAQQQHRRFIKTHSPADCVPIFEECRYIMVYRDGRDALMSWANHRGAMRSEAVEWLNAGAAKRRGGRRGPGRSPGSRPERHGGAD